MMMLVVLEIVELKSGIISVNDGYRDSVEADFHWGKRPEVPVGKFSVSVINEYTNPDKAAVVWSLIHESTRLDSKIKSLKIPKIIDNLV